MGLVRNVSRNSVEKGLTATMKHIYKHDGYGFDKLKRPQLVKKDENVVEEKIKNSEIRLCRMAGSFSTANS